MLYELGFNWGMLFLLLLMCGIIIVFFLIFTYSGNKSFEEVYDVKLPKIFPTKTEIKERAILGLIVGCIIFLIIFFLLIKNNIYVFYCYYTGNYESVVGYVENFNPLKSEEKGDESFSINGVEFSYSENTLTPGYNKTYNKNGVITGNGQYLKIAYTAVGNSNAILCIQQPPFADNPEKETSLIMQFYPIAFPLLLIIIYCLYKRNKKRKRIKIDEKKSFIKQITYCGGKVNVKCLITLNNLFDVEKKIKIYGNFRHFKNAENWKDTVIKGVVENEITDCFVVPVGSCKYNVDFITEIKNQYNTVEDNDSIILPKINIKIAE